MSESSSTPLLLAVSAGSQPWVDHLIDRGAKVNYQDQWGSTALHYAVMAEQGELVSRLLRAGADPDRQSLKGVTPLHIAVSSEQLEIVRALLNKRADRNLEDRLGWSPLRLAARSENPDLRVLLGVNLDPERQRLAGLLKNTDRVSVLNSAAQKGDVELLRELFDAGADLNYQFDDGHTVLSRAVFEGQHDATVWLIAQGANTNAVVNGQSLLQAAAKRGSADILDTLVRQSGPRQDHNINRQDQAGESLLMLSVRSSSLRSVELLLANGADASLQNQGGETALIAALKMDSLPIADALVIKTRNLDARDASGRTALWWACRQNYADVARNLVARGAAFLADERGVNPLHVAAEEDNTSLVELLIAHLDVDTLTQSGNTPMIIAANNQAERVVVQLLEADADIELKNAAGDTALIAAIRSDAYTVAQTLLEAGANANTRNKKFESAHSIVEKKEDARWTALLAESDDSGFFSLFN